MDYLRHGGYMSQSTHRSREQTLATPDTLALSTEERIAFLAQLIVDRIIDDEKNGFTLLEQIEARE